MKRFVPLWLAATLAGVGLLGAAWAAADWRIDSIERSSTARWLSVLASNAEQADRVVEGWLGERSADAEVAAASVVTVFGQLRTDPGSPVLHAHLREGLNALVARPGFTAAWAVDRTGAEVGAPGGTRPMQEERRVLEQVLATGESRIAGPWRGADAGTVEMAFLSPVRAADGQVLGAVVLRVDAAASLLANMEWRIPATRTGQLRLLALQGDTIVVLSPSQLPRNGPMESRRARADAPEPWRRALEEGGITARSVSLDGAPLLAAGRPVDSVPWALLRTIHAEEALGGIRTQVATEGLMLTGMGMAFVLSVLLLGRRQRVARLAATEESRAALAEAQAIAKVGSWDWNRSRQTLHWSDEVYRQHGLEPQSCPATYERFLGSIHPEDLARVQGILAKVSAEGGPFTYAYRVVRADGTVRWLDVRASATLEGGELVRITGTCQDVTEMRATHAALEASEYRHRVLFERNPLPMWLYETETLRFLAVNDAAVDAYGYSREEFLSMTIADLRPPEDVPALLHSRTQRRGGRHHAGVHRHLRKDGTALEVDVISDDAPLGEGGGPARLVLANDVSEARRADRALRDAHALLETLIESLPLAVVTLDPEGRVRTWNAAAERMFGWSAAEVVGQPYPLVPEDRREEQRRLLASMAADPRGTHGLETLRRHRSGRLVDVRLLSAALRDAHGAVHGVVGFFEDVTARKALEEQLRQAQKMEAVGRLAGGVAHDFNNLITAIKGYGEFILDDLPADAECRGDLLEIVRATDRAAALTGQLLAFSRKQLLKPQDVDLNALIREDANMLRRMVGEDIAFDLSLAADPVHVQADPSQLQQILMNLVVNASDTMPDGGTIRIRTALTDGRRADAPGAPARYAVFSVTDTGSGIPPEVVEHIFEPFFTTKETGKGTGLGLATVYGIVKQSDGWLEVDTKVGEGSTFRVYLPAAGAPASGAEAEACPASPAPGTPVDEVRRVLVVEDEPAVRHLVRRALLQQGYEVLEAEDGKTAMAVAARQERLDLLITDLVMPEMRGTALAQEILRGSPELRVLFMSGYTERLLDDSEWAEFAFLQKPFSPAELIAEVRRVLAAPAADSALLPVC